MLHHMKLHPDPFSKICKGHKTIELRLYDQKRQQIRIGDQIEFKNTENSSETIAVIVTNLHRFNSFETMYNSLSPTLFGYEDPSVADPKDMERYYSKEEENLYGVLGIEFVLVALANT